MLARFHDQVEFRVGSDTPARLVKESKSLKPTGQIPLVSTDRDGVIPDYDIRAAADGGCDSPAHFDGCHVYYIKVLHTTQFVNNHIS